MRGILAELGALILELEPWVDELEGWNPEELFRSLEARIKLESSLSSFNRLIECLDRFKAATSVNKRRAKTKVFDLAERAANLAERGALLYQAALEASGSPLAKISKEMVAILRDTPAELRPEVAAILQEKLDVLKRNSEPKD